MARLTHRASGVVVHVADDRAALLPASEWEQIRPVSRRKADDSDGAGEDKK